MFRNPQVNIPLAGIVENMAWFTPEELPENRYYLFGKGGRLLFRQGRITGVLLDDPSGAEDQHGPLIYHAERLRVRRG